VVQPVTTTDILLQEVAGLLTEIRDLLRERPAAAAPERAAKKPTKKAAAAKAPSTRTKAK
jgi:hypothetical protein